MPGDMQPLSSGAFARFALYVQDVAMLASAIYFCNQVSKPVPLLIIFSMLDNGVDFVFAQGS
jgi:hypothetical protein